MHVDSNVPTTEDLVRSGSTTSSPFDGTSKWAYKPRVSPLFLAGSRFSIENLSGSTTLPRSSSSCPNLRLQRNSLPSPITVHREWPIASSLLLPFLPFLAMPGSFLDAGKVEDMEFQNSPNVIQQLRVQVIKAGFCEDQMVASLLDAEGLNIKAGKTALDIAERKIHVQKPLLF